MGVTIKDVAMRAGVSTATVSLVLSGRLNVRISEATRERVKRVALELDFQPNIVARSLISGKTQVLGLVVTDIESLLMARTIRGVERAAHERHHHVIVCEAGGKDDEMDVVRWLKSRGVDGLMLASGMMRTAAIAEYLGRQGIPLVLINQESAEGVPSFAPDHRLVGEMAAQMYLNAGYARPGYFGSAISRASHERLEGFRGVIEGRGAPLECYFEPASRCAVDLVRSAEAFAADALKAGCDCVLCFNDYMAFGACQGVQAAGQRVPDGMAVTGVDNLPITTCTNPPIASFDLRMGEVGYEAAVALIDPQATAGSKRIPPAFMARRSCGRVLDLPGGSQDK
jgi:LacI family transcriptional regulator